VSGKPALPRKAPAKSAIVRRRVIVGLLAFLAGGYWLFIWRAGERAELQNAVEARRPDRVRELLKHGADARATVRDSDSAGIVEQAQDFLREHKIGGDERAVAGRPLQQLRVAPMSLLEKAIADNDVEIVNALMDHGADPNYRHEDGSALLAGAVIAGCSPEIGSSLIRHGAWVDAVNSRAETPLHLAAGSRRTAWVRMLLDNGANVSARDMYGQTPLHRAARADAPDVVRLLVDRGASLRALDNAHETPLASGARYRAANAVVALLDRGGDPADLHRQPGDEPLTWIVMRGDLKLLRRCWEHILTPDQRALEGPDALLGAAWTHNVPAVEYLLQQGVDVNADQKRATMPGDMYSLTTTAGWLPTPGPIKPTARMPLLVAAISTRNVPLVRMLLSHGCCPNVPGKPIQTPLAAAVGAAADGGLPPPIEEAGKIRAVAPTPLGSFRPRLSGVAATAGPQASAPPPPRRLRHFMVARPDVAPPPPPDSAKPWFEIVRQMLAAGADARAVDVRGSTALHAAVAEPSLVKLLIAHGAEVDARNRFGATPLMIASQQGAQSIEPLVAAGADVNATDKRGATPLMYAVWSADRQQAISAVRLLLKCGAQADQRDAQGMTALDRLRRLPPPPVPQTPRLGAAPVVLRATMGAAAPPPTPPRELEDLLTTPATVDAQAGRK